MERLSDPAFWAAASLGIAVVTSAFVWLALHFSPLRRLARWPIMHALAWLARALFVLWLPLLAWRSGALSPYYMGLTETDWLDALGTSGLLTVAIIGLALLGWLVYRRRVREEPLLLQAGAAGGLLEGHPAGTAAPRWLAPLSAALDQWHWTFYRAAAIGWLAGGAAAAPHWLAGRVPFLAAPLSGILTLWQAQPFYWGCWLGVLVAGIEWLASPFTWSALRTPGKLERALRAASVCLATAALFSLTRNFWLCLLCSLAVETLAAGWFPMPEPETQG